MWGTGPEGSGIHGGDSIRVASFRKTFGKRMQGAPKIPRLPLQIGLLVQRRFQRIQNHVAERAAPSRTSRLA